MDALDEDILALFSRRSVKIAACTRGVIHRLQINMLQPKASKILSVSPTLSQHISGECCKRSMEKMYTEDDSETRLGVCKLLNDEIKILVSSEGKLIDD